MLELGEGGPPVLGRELRQLGARPRTSMLVDCNPSGDRERPRAEMLAVPQLGICAERAEKRLLECILGAIASEPADEKGIDLLPMLLVEAFERRQAHVTIF